VKALSSWDCWMEILPDLVWPAQGLGPWEPRAARALGWKALLGLKEETRKGLPRQIFLACRGRLERLMGLEGWEEDLESSLRLAPSWQARAWRAETLLEKEPREALALLRGAEGFAPCLYRGAAWLRLKRWSLAARAFQEAGALRPGFLPCLLEGFSLLRLGRAAQALEALLRAKGSGECAALRWFLAYAYDSLGDEQGVRRSVEEAMRLFPELGGLESLLGKALARESLLRLPLSRKTLGLLSRACRGPREAWARVARAESLRSPEFSRYQEALPDLRRAARLLPSSGWVWAHLGRGLQSVDRTNGPLKALKKAVELSPECGWARAWLGAWHLRRGGPRALPELDRAVRLMPEYPFAHAWRGSALRRLGRLSEAAQELETALLLEPEYEYTYSELFEVRRAQGRWAEAARFLTEAYEREMKFSWARRDDPSSCRRALSELDSALEACPGEPLLKAWRAWVRLGLGDREGARGELRGLSGPAFAYFVQGQLEESQGRIARACWAYGRAAELKPCATYLGLRGMARYRLGDLKGARKDLSLALEKNSTVAGFLWALAALDLEQGRPAQALEGLERAAGLTRFSELLALRAEALRLLGRRKKALRELEEARRLRPDCPWTALASSRLERDPLKACSELLKAVERGSELPQRVLERARSLMRRFALKALRELGGDGARRLPSDSRSLLAGSARRAS